MLLANKGAFTELPVPGLVCSVQYAFTCVAVLVMAKIGLAQRDPVEIGLVRKYWVVPAAFATAIFANGKLLEHANVETFLLIRFTTPLLVALLDFLLLEKELPTARN